MSKTSAQSARIARTKGHLTLVTETRDLKQDRQIATVKRQVKPGFDTAAAIKFLKN